MLGVARVPTMALSRLLLLLLAANGFSIGLRCQRTATLSRAWAPSKCSEQSSTHMPPRPGLSARAFELGCSSNFEGPAGLQSRSAHKSRPCPVLLPRL